MDMKPEDRPGRGTGFPKIRLRMWERHTNGRWTPVGETTPVTQSPSKLHEPVTFMTGMKEANCG